MIIINFKTYEKATGEDARKLGEVCRKVRNQTDKEIIASPAAEDMLRLDHIDIPVFSQHVDSSEPGSHTGHTLIETVEKAGATGTLLNHSERRIPKEDIKKNSRESTSERS